MIRQFPFPCLVVLAIIPLALFATQPNPDLEKLRKKPITTAQGKVGALLKQWWQEGSAAGNAGDFYDNRDGDHSPLNLAPWPQMSAIKYSPTDIKLRKHWAAQRVIVPHVTFGNSSTSAPAHLGGSNPRQYYVSQFGLSFLYEQYTKNNLYIYPEHRDHDPGHNGLLHAAPFGRGSGAEGGHGDLYPTNTPYLLISQGSSGSDQPFMRMMPVVLAAFRPEVKKKLIETGTLMPTIQMLFRSSNKHLTDPKEYLTGKAHPTVFAGKWVDELAVVQKAHALEMKSLPPMVQLRVTDADNAKNGIDFFDRAPSEVLAYTPACIARVHRGKALRQRIVVDAGASFDVNKHKLRYAWVILRGDPGKITITPKKDDRSAVEITVAYHERRPTEPGSPLASNRVDIGCFVHNGTHYSAPGFVTFYTLDREARTYDERGLPLEIAHGMGQADVRVKDWEELLARLCDDAVASLLQISMKQRDILDETLVERKLIAIIHGIGNKRLKKAQALVAAAKTNAEKQAAKKELDDARADVAGQQKSLDGILDRRHDALGGSPRRFFESRFAKLVQDPLFTVKHRDSLKKQTKPANETRIKALWQKLVHLGLAKADGTLTPLLPGKTLADAKWTRFERAKLEWLHASLLAELAFPGALQVDFQTNYVDHRLSVPRAWRDLYRYDAKGQCIGWTRHSTAGEQSFNHEGLLVVDTDALGRCAKARVVTYTRDAMKGKAFIHTNPLRMVPGDTIVRYEFADKNDWRGKRIK